MTAIAEGDRDFEVFRGYWEWAESSIPYVKAHGQKHVPGIDIYHLTFGFRKIHIGDLPKNRYKFTLREHEDNFLEVHHNMSGQLVGFMSWFGGTRPYVRLSYITKNENERKQMETFIGDYLDHCEEAESKFERACFDTSSHWAKKQPWYKFISKPQLMVIHNMDHTLGRFKKPWREAYGKNTEKGIRYTMVSAKEKQDTVHGTNPKDLRPYLE